MEPLFDRDGVTLYCADAEDVLSTMADDSVDLVLTDPPYPNLKGGLVHGAGGVGPSRRRSVTVGDPWAADLAWLPEAWRVARLGLMTFCSFTCVAEMRMALPDAEPVALLTWYKRNAAPPVQNVPRHSTEFIWAFRKASGLDWRALRDTLLDIPNANAGCMADERFVDDDGRAAHPTQKPEELLRRLLAVGGDSVLDPFAGTGTTLKAAYDLGRRAIGVERDRAACLLAAGRFDQRPLPLPDPTAPPEHETEQAADVLLPLHRWERDASRRSYVCVPPEWPHVAVAPRCRGCGVQVDDLDLLRWEDEAGMIGRVEMSATLNWLAWRKAGLVAGV
jgi:hypothetical protein